MNISRLVLMVTGDCNFSCRYCYHTRTETEMGRDTAEKAIDFFLPRMPESYDLYFLGGEPLLNIHRIREIVQYAEKKNKKLKKRGRFNLSTNGSLLIPKIMDFLNRHRFVVELGFDGLAQDRGRQKGSFKPLVAVAKKLITYPDITLVVNSVFFPPTVTYLSRSIQYLLDLGVPRLSLGLAVDRRWNRPSIDKLETHFHKLTDILETHFRKTGNQPLHFFPDLESQGIWCCSAGQSQLTVSPGGEVWGCALFQEYHQRSADHNWYRNYCFGPLEEFMKNHGSTYPEISGNYRKLCMENFYTSDSRCFLCPDIEKCGVCPASSAFYHHVPHRVPHHICRINRIAIRAKEKLNRRLGN